ncbi:MAG TPA: glycoside hydrolase family 3 C-terminal domain-containing protein [Actinomycetes bacterium]|nr:glycoside hydrolase family 3 C-terminal domain-containing protein [Actinomycetes bacterium]
MKSYRFRNLMAIAAAAAVTVALGAATGAAADHGHPGGPPGGTTSPPVARNAPYTATVRYLLGQLTVDEKLSLIHGSIGEGIITPNTPTDPGANGSIGVAPGVPRLGIPTFRSTDSNGINVFADSTAFPGRLGLAATFDVKGISRFGTAMGKEGRALGIDLVYAPQLDLTRLPSWGRNLTTYGEDPYLASQLGVTDVNAIQSTGLLAQIKHFAFYNGQDQDTPSLVQERAAHELYLKAYEATIRDAAPSSVMCSYAKYQVVPVQTTPDYACENTFGLHDVLRDAFNFKGWVGSDYGGSHATSDLLAGLDQEFLSNSFAPAALKPLVDATSPTFDPRYAAALDGAVARILYQYQRFGRLDDSTYPPYAKTGLHTPAPPNQVNERAGIQLARSLAEESAVLLKNDDATLPLARTKRSSIAVIGPTADLMPAAPTNERSRGFGQRNTISPLDVLRKKAGRANVTYTPGIDRIGTVPTDALRTSPGGSRGLTRTTKDVNGNVVGTQVDAQLAGDQTDLVKGDSYTWTGTLDVPADDTYTLWLQRPAGTVVGHPDGPNAGVNPGYRAGPFTGVFDSVSLSVDGSSQSLKPVSTILANTYPGGPTLNGQYLGLNVVGSALPLTAGTHQISISYAPNAKAATAPTFRLTWAAQNKDAAAAVDAASKADTAVVFVDDADTTTTPGDVSTLGPGEDALVERVAAANPNTVVVLNTNAAVQMPWLTSVKSVLEMWYPGQEGGTATADLLYGKANPSGKLPITFPVDNAHTPFAGHPERAVPTNGAITWSEGLEIGYRWYLANHVAPQFPFGFGESYTRFAYSDLRVGRQRHDGRIDVSFRVRNVGPVTGTEVPQVYLTLPASSGEPAKRLVAFDRLELRPGHSSQVKLTIDPRDDNRPLSIWDTTTHDWRIPSGRFGISVGSSVADAELAGGFDVR